MNNNRWSIDRDLIDPSKGQRDKDPIMPGFNELPFRGIVPDLKNEDPEPIQPKQGCRVHVEILELHKPEDCKRMEDIFTMLANGYATISAEERIYDADLKTWRVFLRWADLYVFNPAKGV